MSGELPHAHSFHSVSAEHRNNVWDNAIPPVLEVESVLVEQYGLTHGSTWHSAGLVGQLRSTVSLTKMMQYSVGLYAELARETGKDPGWHELGGLRLASSRERYEEIQRQAFENVPGGS